MGTCPECGNEIPDEATVCRECGADVEPTARDGPTALMDADYDPEEEREQFERRFGIDIGDRSVDEFLDHLDQQDYSLTGWFWLFAVAEIAGIAAFVFNLWGPGLPRMIFRLVYPTVSILLGLAIFGDTRVVGQFRTWSRIRWTYVLLAAVPLVGHIAGFLYAVLRRLMHEQTTKHRRRLIDAGFDLSSGSREA